MNNITITKDGFKTTQDQDTFFNIIRDTAEKMALNFENEQGITTTLSKKLSDEDKVKFCESMNMLIKFVYGNYGSMTNENSSRFRESSHTLGSMYFMSTGMSDNRENNEENIKKINEEYKLEDMLNSIYENKNNNDDDNNDDNDIFG